MKIEEMNLEQVVARLAELDELVERSQKVEEIDEATEEKKGLLDRKAELEELQKRKKDALDLQSGTIQADRIIEVRKEEKHMDFEKMSPSDIRATEEYRTAFLKALQGKPLNDVEKRTNEMASTDVAGVIPTITQERIFNKLKEYAPLLNEITLLQVPGNVTFAVEGTNTAAAKHAENTEITPAADKMGSVSLAGFEIVKVLRISATVQAMAINAFEGWLSDYLAEGIAAKVGEYIIYGDGDGDPKGIDYADTWSDETNAVSWASTAPTVDELVELVSYLKAGYHRRAKFLMNSKTFWGKIVAEQDNSKFKILTDDYKRLLGYPILLDDNVADDDIFFGDFKKVVGNLSQNIKVDRSTESGFLYNAIDYRGTAIFDCDIADDEAFVKSAETLTAGA
jgi:HK97 family phage major capsid protein